MNRRQFLAAVPTTLAGTTGCLSFEEAGDTETTASEEGSVATERATASDATETATEEVSDGSVEWSGATMAPVTGPPALGAETVYVHSSDRRLYAFDRASGDERWQLELGDPASSSIPGRPLLVSEEVVLATTTEGVHAVSRSSGAERWRASSSWSGAAPMLVADDVVAYFSDDRTLRAVDLSTGDRQWTHSLDERGLALVETDASDSGHVLTGDVGSDECHLQTVALGSGERQSRTSLAIANQIRVPRHACVSNGVLVSTVDRYSLAGFDVDTGERLWARAHSEGVAPPFTVADGTVYAKGSDDEVGQDAIDVRSGERRWEFAPHGSGRCCRVAPAVAGDTVFFANTGDLALAGVDAESGELRWRYEGAADTEARPAVTEDAVYVGAQDGHLYRVRR